ncbi:hypothetical protein [Pedobacter sp. SYP-B3415]|uniref:hypothetical protein n=1 Tax=Pedobacter sp. SYP-B3415 TaxID=2496641 RepID=UPI00101BDB97|nr:hypothetical protein [Pedobacter sp. SYP-B3415]
MKKVLKIALIVVILLAIPAILLIANRLKAHRLDLTYAALGDHIESRNFILEELTLKGKTLEYYRFDGEFDQAGELDSALQHLEPARHWPKDGGYVQFDTLKKQFMIGTTEYVSRGGKDGGLPDELKNVCYFDEKGKLTGHISNLYSIKKDWRQHAVLLPDFIPNFPQWKDRRSHIYLRHFGIERLETSWLKPFRGMGSPNGAGAAPAWSGTGYFDLTVEGEQIRFRCPATKDGLLFLAANDFDTDLSYCRFRKVFRKPLPAFLIYQPRFGQGRVFIIRRKL